MNLTVQWPPPGRYILAVSGGADSMVMLDIVARAASERSYELVVAHFDHGLRAQSATDRDFVAQAAAQYELAFESEAAHLGTASEAAARAARHDWLEQTRRSHGAAGVLTAHHEDDLLETSLLNLARGSGRLGLAPMQPGGHVLRPLIRLRRASLREYAAAHDIAWREDPSNADISNSRNLLRHRLLPSASPQWRRRYLELIEELAILNIKITQSISTLLRESAIDAQTYAFALPALRAFSSTEREELILAAARALRPGIQLDQPLIAEIAEFARTGTSRKYRPLRQGLVLSIVPGFANLTTKSPH